MVDVSSQNNSVSINVSSSGNSASIKASPDTAQYYSEKSREWAISNRIVDGVDYSSKYYAQQSGANAQKVVESENKVKEIYNTLLEESSSVSDEIREVGNETLTNIETVKNEAINSINGSKTTIINDIEFVADGEKKEIEDLIDNGKEELKESIGDVKVLTTLEIGDIGIAPLGIDETKGKRRYLNGQLIIQEQYVQFTNKVKSAIELYPSLACTESEWQTTATMTVGGQVGKFVVDNDAGTIRLPKIIMPIQGLTDLSKLAEIVEAGLPNIEGQIYDIVCGATGSASGALLKAGGATGNGLGNSSAQFNTFNFDASLSNPIYGNSKTVQQEQIQYPYFIQVATGAETKDNITNELELNNPFSLLDYKYSEYELNNISWLRSNGQYNSKAIYPAVYDLLLKIYNGTETKAGVSVKLHTEDYTDEDFVINQDDETFRLQLKVKLASGKAVVGNGNPLILNIGNTDIAIGTSKVDQNPYIAVNTNNVNSNLGDDFAGTVNSTTAGKTLGVTTDATKSGIETSDSDLYLYFYVGETVQNANLINAGRIEEKLVDKLDRNNKEEIVSWGMPDYSSGISANGLYTSTNKFVAPCDGVLIYFAWCATESLTLYVNDTPISNGYGSSLGYGSAYPITLFLNKGDTYYQSSAVNVRPNPDCAFYPLKGVN